MSGGGLLEELGENWCVTVVRSDDALSRDTVTARLGSVVAEPVMWDRSMDRFHDIDWDREPFRAHYLLAQVDRAGRTWVVVEPYGIEATRQEVQALLSQGASTFTLLTNENALHYSLATRGSITGWTDVALEDPPDDVDRLARAFARLQHEGGVVLDEAGWTAPRWLVLSEPFPRRPAASSTSAVTPERLALILGAVAVAADKVGLDDRPEVVAALGAMRE